MKECQSYGNSYLRHLESARKFEDSMTMYTQSVAELLSALQQIQIYVKRMNTGKAKIRIHRGVISMSIDASKEMCL